MLSKIKVIQISAFFQLFIPNLTHVSLLERKLGFEIDKQLPDTREQPSLQAPF